MGKDTIWHYFVWKYLTFKSDLNLQISAEYDLATYLDSARVGYHGPVVTLACRNVRHFYSFARWVCQNGCRTVQLTGAQDPETLNDSPSCGIKTRAKFGIYGCLWASQRPWKCSALASFHWNAPIDFRSLALDGDSKWIPKFRHCGQAHHRIFQPLHCNF